MNFYPALDVILLYKIKYNNEGCGIIFKYLENLCYNGSNRREGLLIDPNQFLLLCVGFISHLTKTVWEFTVVNLLNRPLRKIFSSKILNAKGEKNVIKTPNRFATCVFNKPKIYSLFHLHTLTKRSFCCIQ